MTWRALSARPYPPDLGIRALLAVLQLAASPAIAPPAVFAANPFDWTLFLQHVPDPPPHLFAAVAAELDAAAAAAATAAGDGSRGGAIAADGSELSEEVQVIATMPRDHRFHAIQAGPAPQKLLKTSCERHSSQQTKTGLMLDMCRRTF